MKILIISCFFWSSYIGFGQNKHSLEAFAPIYAIENPDFQVDLNQEFKAVFDISKSGSSKDQPNKMFTTLARFLRMHTAPELKNNSVKAAMVIHGTAVFDLLTHDEYAKYHKEEELKNPNFELLSLLSKNNVEIILCGQTSKHREVSKEMLQPEVKIALSAMTALIDLQKKDYQLINF